jgi:hypothetical protein
LIRIIHNNTIIIGLRPKHFRYTKVLGRGFGGEPFFRRVSPEVLADGYFSQ